MRALNFCLAVSVAAAMTSCGGTSDNPASPTPAAPRFPVMTGTWSGTRTVETIVMPGSGAPTVTTCNETWLIRSQIEGQFAGIFQRSGGCTEAGSMTGTVSMAGDVTGLTFNVPGASRTTTCRIVSGDGVYTGRVNLVSLIAHAAEREVCVAGGAGLQFDRSFSLSMNRQY